MKKLSAAHASVPVSVSRLSMRQGFRRLLVSGVIGALLSTAPAYDNNPAPTIKADAPNRYVVKRAIRFGTSQDVT